MEKEFYILFNPVDYLNNEEVREIMKRLEKPTFFVMPAYKEDGYVIKMLDPNSKHNKILITKAYPDYIKAINVVETFNFDLPEEYFMEEEFLDWKEEMDVEIFYEDDYPSDQDIFRVTNNIKQNYDSDMVYILYPLDDSYEFFKIAFVLGKTVFRIETNWLMRDIWINMPKFHLKVKELEKFKLTGLQSITIREGII